MFDVAHFLMVLYVCFMSPYSALQNHHSDAERVVTTIIVSGLLLNIYIQLTTANYDKVSLRGYTYEIRGGLNFVLATI